MNSSFSHLLVLSVVSVSAALSAQDLDPLAKSAGFTPTVTFSESHSERLVTTIDRSDPDFPLVMREVVPSESISISVVANITGVVLSDLDETTAFSLTLGGVSVSGTLADDPKYVKGKTSIFIPAEAFDNDGNPIPSTQGVRLSWTASRLTMTITGSTANTMPGDVEMSNWTDATTAPVPAIRAISTVELSFADFIAPVRNVYVTGQSSKTTKTYGSEDEGTLETFEMVNVSLTGNCEYTSPITTLISPQSGSTTGPAVTITGKSSDGQGIATVEYVVNPTITNPTWVDVPTLNITPLANPDLLWGSTSATWSIPLTGLPLGTSELWVRTTDISSNQSTLVVKLVNPLPTSLQSRWDAVLEPTAVGPVRGAITFTVAVNGFYTGRLLMETIALPISGYIDTRGRFSLPIRRTGQTELTLQGDILGATTNLNGLLIAGTLKDGAGNGATFNAYRSPYSATALASADLEGRFHIGIAAPSSPVMGQSYLIATTARKGTASITGRMADGTAVTWSGVLGVNGEMPVFVPMYATMYLTKGSLSAPLKIDGPTHAIPAVNVNWARPLGATDKQFPPGYNLVLSASGSLYSKPAANTRVMALGAGAGNAQASISGDAVPSLFSQPFTVNTNNTTTPVLPNPNGLTIATIPAATGLGTGSFKLPGTATKAAINFLIIGNQAVGHYIAPALTGTVNKQFGNVTLSAPSM